MTDSARDVIDAVPITVMDNMGGYYESTIGEQLGADAILTDLRDAGFAVVPVEPTERMKVAAQDKALDLVGSPATFMLMSVYKAMLKAAQGGTEP